jgi:hypothetical protein
MSRTTALGVPTIRSNAHSRDRKTSKHRDNPRQGHTVFQDGYFYWAKLGTRSIGRALVCNQEVGGSIPLDSTEHQAEIQITASSGFGCSTRPGSTPRGHSVAVPAAGTTAARGQQCGRSRYFSQDAEGRTRRSVPREQCPESDLARPRPPEETYPAGADEIDPGPGGVLLKDRLAWRVRCLLPSGEPFVELSAREEPEQRVAGQMRRGHRLLHPLHYSEPDVASIQAAQSSSSRMQVTGPALPVFRVSPDSPLLTPAVRSRTHPRKTSY